DQPILARRHTVRQRLTRWGRRHPGLVASFGLVVGLLLAGAWAWNRETTQADSAARVVAGEADRLKKTNRLPEALLEARRARDLLPRFGGDRALRHSIEEQIADFAFLATWEEVRLEMAASVRADGRAFDTIRAEPLYRKMFLDYGFDILYADED